MLILKYSSSAGNWKWSSTQCYPTAVEFFFFFLITLSRMGPIAMARGPLCRCPGPAINIHLRERLLRLTFSSLLPLVEVYPPLILFMPILSSPSATIFGTTLQRGRFPLLSHFSPLPSPPISTSDPSASRCSSVFPNSPLRCTQTLHGPLFLLILLHTCSIRISLSLSFHPCLSLPFPVLR